MQKERKWWPQRTTSDGITEAYDRGVCTRSIVSGKVALWRSSDWFNQSSMKLRACWSSPRPAPVEIPVWGEPDFSITTTSHPAVMSE
ncbi:hypothetical protein C5167_025821 [Papaver somniferum]|uniref:Uncharacterized protein n=1 Tax=Papaver somniferum TaxID=3469 RepID=A0A4Y7JSH6_PAPSO|nr:hypothetical protein C5167_025821 [Papaver somniferum]